MKNYLIVSLLLFSLAVHAQKDVTKFLGIPVDGYKPEMIQKLKEKGFRSTADDPEVLEGEFNGNDVRLHVVTNNNKVWRIMLTDKNKVGKTDIRIRFNKLCEQFSNNPKYVSFGDYTISEDEDISYEITVNDKRYEAAFYQTINSLDTTAFIESFYPLLSEKYTEEQLENPTEDMQKELMEIGLDYAVELMQKKSVWFMISNFRGEYYITMFYDNEYNKANGEDL